MAWTERLGNDERDAGWDAGLMQIFATGDATTPSPFVARDDRPTILLATSGGRADELARMAERAGFRSLGIIRPCDIAQRLATTVAVDHIFVDLRGADLDGQNARTLARRHDFAEARLSVITDLAGLDSALSQLDGPGTEFLCDPTVGDIVHLLVTAAIEAEQWRSNPELHDSGRESDAGRMETLSEEVRRLATMVERLAHAGALNGEAAGAAHSAPAYRTVTASEDRLTDRLTVADGSAMPDTPSHSEIKALLRARRLREQYLPSDLFADPAWDMILDLMAARLANQRVSVSSLCIAAAVPPTTALRWIRQLTDRGVFSRIDDPADGRRVFIQLTDAAAESVMAWSLAVRRTGGLLPPPEGRIQPGA